MVIKFLYYLHWGFKALFLGKKIPLNGSLILTDKCNLACRHCTVANLGYESLPISKVRRDVNALFQAGSRMLVITGGEPLIWQDEQGNTVEDVVSIAREAGFFRTVICNCAH